MSATHTSSTHKVPYDLRPSKQAERYIIVDTLIELTRAGLDISKYHYVGFGSIFFQDFRILHVELGVTKMTSIEGDASLIRRCHFNKPYSSIDIFEGMSSEFLPSLDRDQNYLVWLDYDFGFNEIVYEDLVSCCSRLVSGSALIVTIDTELPGHLRNSGPEELFNHYSSLPASVMQGFDVSDFTPSARELTLRRMISRSVRGGFAGRHGMQLVNLFSLAYADGHRMYTMGGVICDEHDRERIVSSPVTRLEYVVQDYEAGCIEIPKFVLTRKEKSFLEPFCVGDSVYRGSIGVHKDVVRSYRKFYRYIPDFAETS